MPQITTARLRTLDQRWRSTVNKYRGAAPVGFAIAHMVAESNGVATPTVRDAKRSIGIMRIPSRTGLKYGYTEEQLEDPIRNIYTWGLLTNANSQKLQRLYPSSWTVSNRDFWLSVRLLFVLGLVSYKKLFALALPTAGAITAASGTTTLAIQTWIRTAMPNTQRAGTFTARDLRRIADELDKFADAIVLLDGVQHISPSFTMAPTVTPDSALDAARVARVRSA